MSSTPPTPDMTYDVFGGTLNIAPLQVYSRPRFNFTITGDLETLYSVKLNIVSSADIQLQTIIFEYLYSPGKPVVTKRNKLNYMKYKHRRKHKAYQLITV